MLFVGDRHLRNRPLVICWLMVIKVAQSVTNLICHLRINFFIPLQRLKPRPTSILVTTEKVVDDASVAIVICHYSLVTQCICDLKCGIVHLESTFVISIVLGN